MARTRKLNRPKGTAKRTAKKDAPTGPKQSSLLSFGFGPSGAGSPPAAPPRTLAKGDVVNQGSPASPLAYPDHSPRNREHSASLGEQEYSYDEASGSNYSDAASEIHNNSANAHNNTIKVSANNKMGRKSAHKRQGKKPAKPAAKPAAMQDASPDANANSRWNFRNRMGETPELPAAQSQIIGSRISRRQQGEELIANYYSTGSPSRASASKTGREMSASSSLSPPEQAGSPPNRVAGKKAAAKVASSEESSDDEHQPPPAPATTHLTTFGENPWDFPDPTEYEIKPITPGMSEEKKKKIFSVAEYPHDDLSDKIPGTPPDEDFSTKKNVGTQVQANTFATHVESYLRPFTEEDLAWVRERHSNPNDFVVPKRGKKHYHQVWDEEDGKANPRRGLNRHDNEARGSVDDLDEAMAETDKVSTGPLAERVLGLFRPERRPVVDPAANGAANDNADLDNVLGLEPTPSNAPPKLPPATQMPESNTEAWKKAVHPQLDPAQVDQRLKQELQFLGFIPQDTVLDYSAAYDDEVAARTRALQKMLAEVSARNNAKKAILTEKLQDHLAFQEFSNIKDDLDSQVVSNFGKRTRSMGKKSKAKRPGGAGGGSHSASGMAKPAIGDATKNVLDKRQKWINQIGPVFEDAKFSVPRSSDPNSDIFTGEKWEMALKREQQLQKEEIAEAQAEAEDE